MKPYTRPLNALKKEFNMVVISLTLISISLGVNLGVGLIQEEGYPFYMLPGLVFSVLVIVTNILSLFKIYRQTTEKIDN